MNNKTREITIYAMYLAIFAIMSFIPYIGYIKFGPNLTITTMVVPLTVITVHKGWKGALIGSLFFGALSIPAGIEQGSIILTLPGIGNGIMALFFARILTGVILAILITWLRKVVTLRVQLIIIGLVAAIFNTVFVVALLYAVGFEPKGMIAILITIWINVVVEWIITPLISVAFAPVIKRLTH